MCLTEQFFKEREKAREKYLTKGYIDLDDLFEDGRTSEDELFIVGFIQMKEEMSTAELNNWEVSEDGKRYLKEFKNPQLVLVKPGQLDALLQEIERKA